jgi:putative effector of murein hydrolase
MMTSIGTVALLAQNPVFGVAITLLAYEIGRWVQRHSGGRPLANPVLIAIVLIVAGLELCRIPYDTYLKGGGLIQFMLGPATVALALPIYANATRIRGAAAGIAAGVAVGATVASASAVGIAWLLGVPDDLLRSIASKSVTTPIAIGISQEIGGYPH